MIQHPENESLKNEVFNVLQDLIHGMFNVEFKFHGFDEIQIEIVDQLKIVQDFVGSYNDIIFCAFTLLPEQALTIVKAYQDLKCAITLTKAENNTGTILQQYDPIQLEYRVLIQNPADLLKRLNSKEFIRPKDEAESEQWQPIRVPISMQLVDPKIYELRHIEFTDNWKDVDVKTALELFGSVFQKTPNGEEIYEEVKIAEPDNTRTYAHMSIPPMLNFSNAWAFLQERFGVYNFDIGVYLFNKKLLIYPKNENHPKEPINPGILHIYKVGTDQYPGSDGYSSKIGDDIHVMCTKPIDIRDLSEANAEDVGNAIVVSRTDMALDTNRQVIENGIKQDPQKAITVISPNSNTAVPGIQNAKYVTSQDNVHNLMATMTANDCAVAKIDVLYLDLFCIYPNNPCILHYEENGEYKTVNGVVVGCSYNLRYEGRPADHLYGFQCSLIVRLVPDKKDGETSQE